ncbi:MAG: uncharacterized protein A8A55_1806, partial [Amphiamblys sp. WSBS2006]
MLDHQALGDTPGMGIGLGNDSETYLWFSLAHPRLVKAKLKKDILADECPGCKGAAEDETHWVFHCPAWEDGRLAADKETGITIGERDRWTPSIPIDIVCGEMSLE